MPNRWKASAVPFRLAFLSLAGLLAAAAPEGRAEDARETGRDRPAERAEWNTLFRRDTEGRVLSENRLKALDAACQMPADPSMAEAPAGSFSRSAAGPSVRSSYTFTGTTWQSLGPLPMQAFTGIPTRQYGNVGGRVDAIAAKPGDPNTILIGTATGGIWKSTDAGSTWRPVSDTAPSLATSAICFSQSNPSIVFAATGEVDAVSSWNAAWGTYLGAGLLKSVDGGDSWTRIDTNLPSQMILSRVLVRPDNPQQVLVGVYDPAGAASGVYRSTDGGVTFSRTFSAGNVSDLAQDPNSPQRVYMGTGRCTGCPSYGVFGSLDFGATWLEVFTTPTSLGNVKLGVSRTNPAVLYASILAAADNSHASPGGIFVSTDAGVTWQQRSVDASMCPTQASGEGNQCWYDHVITPDPANPSTLWFGSVSLYRSTDSGNSWTKFDVYPETGVATFHPDQHAVTFVSGAAYIGNDGGVYKSADGGQTFQNLNATLNVAQFNGIALHPTNTSFAMGGTQDNGNQRYTGSLAWSDRTGGDGGFNVIRRDSPAQILSGYVRQGMFYSSDSGQNFSFIGDCDGQTGYNSISCADLLAFYPPVVSPPNSPSTVLFGTNRVWANATFGQNVQGWQARSPAKITNSYFTTLDAPAGDTGPVWAGTLTGSIFFSTDGGATFASRFTGLPSAPVTRVLSVTADGRSAYATYAGYLGAPSKHVFRTTDAGVTWTNISNNLPDVPVLDIKVDPTDPNDLFVGTDVGVFRSTNGGASWVSFNAGLPSVTVNALAFHPVTNDLWAATFGRGVWRVTNSGGGGGGLAANFTFSPPSPTAGQTVSFSDTSTGSPTAWSWDFGDGFSSTARNPTHAFAAAGTYPVTLTASAGSSSSVTKNVSVAQAGASTCVENAQTMCLAAGRYRITSHWRNQYAGGAVSTLSKAKLTDVTGAFWIQDSSTYEYLLRVSTGTDNGRAWFAIPTFTDVEFFIEVTDTRTGQSKQYHSVPGNRTLIFDPNFFVYP